MMDTRDKSAMIELHKLMDQPCDGLVNELYERMSDRSAQIIKLPGLHERNVSRSEHLANGLRQHPEQAVVLDFPRPQWLRNADRR
ncbi:hypothetical protein [Allorhizobium terrae]|uniref:Uncharacterized protein n=1 Tax=Allorhizobium terrae TaxID=1848972 RepID=A0A4S4A5P5_9HYPH|nr:hypothetical protein [Allorhizobium terrae]THF53689.1 hypothetical protein E6C51_00780 [Allorhizobium terrae]